MIELKVPIGLLSIYGMGLLADASPDFVSVFGQHGVIGGIAIVSTLSHLYVINYLLKLLKDNKTADDAAQLARETAEKTERKEERALAELRIKMLSEMAVAITKLSDSVNDLKRS